MLSAPVDALWLNDDEWQLSIAQYISSRGNYNHFLAFWVRLTRRLLQKKPPTRRYRAHRSRRHDPSFSWRRFTAALLELDVTKRGTNVSTFSGHQSQTSEDLEVFYA